MKQIPKIIHYFWVGNNPKPESVKYCIESWKKYCPDYKIIEWNESNYDFTKNQYMKEAYESKKWGFVPDYARLDVIYNYGGIYLDTDVEVIKNFDELLNQNAFIGFENTGDDEYFINCGQGFGSVAKNKAIKEMMDVYETVSFINSDGTLNMLPSPHYTTRVLEKYGLIRDNNEQDLELIKVYKSDVLCPKNFISGDIKITSNTYSIHHFTASWLDERIRQNMDNERKIYKKYGKKIGRYVLLIQSVLEKYKSTDLITKLPIRILKKLVGQLQESYYNALDYLSLWKSIFKNKLNLTNSSSDNVLIYNTYMNSDNSGDNIIMENCMNILEEKCNINSTIHIPTHTLPDQDIKNLPEKKVVCGTNILSADMRKYGLWKLPRNLDSYNGIILMGVGFGSRDNKFNLYTKQLLKYMLSPTAIHSVRDSFSAECLKSIGIKNVINTSCPTMWKLNKELCSKIPTTKGKYVISTITDYHRDAKNDSMMLDILINNYEKVYLWLQGRNDYEYINELGYSNKVEFIQTELENYDMVLNSSESIDYVGTRLHAGIRAMAYKRRSIIISIDNRAESIAFDTGLPIIKRDEIDKYLESKIQSSFNTEINLPMENIKMWINQFE